MLYFTVLQKNLNESGTLFLLCFTRIEVVALPLHGKVKKILLSVHRIDLIPVMKVLCFLSLGKHDNFDKCRGIVVDPH